MPDRAIVLDEATWDRLKAVIQWAESAMRRPPSPPPSPSVSRGFWAKITGHTMSGEYGSYKSTYDFVQVYKTAAGYAADAWATLPGGISGVAYNGNELEEDWWPYMDDRGVGMIVRMDCVRVDGTLEFWFTGSYVA
jgi:hypothetical protein